MKPILFNTQMVRAILDGEKTCTRRLIKGVPTGYEPLGYVLYPTNDKELGKLAFGGKGANVYYAKTPYEVGDILYVRETWANVWLPDGQELPTAVYKADGKPENFPYWGNAKQCKSEVWIPSIHMPKIYARIFLKVTSVKVERLQDITDEGCYQEGISGTSFYDEAEHIQIAGIGLNDSLERAAFSLLWNSTVKEDKYLWVGNPWVWVIGFEWVKEGK